MAYSYKDRAADPEVWWVDILPALKDGDSLSRGYMSVAAKKDI
jgi:hypothetical protein